jgi:hypothetical protein
MSAFEHPIASGWWQYLGLPSPEFGEFPLLASVEEHEPYLEDRGCFKAYSGVRPSLPPCPLPLIFLPDDHGATAEKVCRRLQ